jgi:phosphoserine phosphatase
MDGTLTEKDDSWLYIHQDLGVWEQAKIHRKLFSQKKINYQDWADLDVGLWRNTSLEKLIGIILSSGLSFFAERLKTQFNFDYAIANAPIVGPDGRLTGEIKVKVGYDDKPWVLQKFIKGLDITLKECIAVADGENDIPLFKEVGFSIAFNPLNEAIAKAASVAI